MTDTEILDYLQESITLRGTGPVDAQIGSVTFTLGLRPGTLRELLEKAINEDKLRRVNQVTRALVAGAKDVCVVEPDLVSMCVCSLGTKGCRERHA